MTLPELVNYIVEIVTKMYNDFLAWWNSYFGEKPEDGEGNV